MVFTPACLSFSMVRATFFPSNTVATPSLRISTAYPRFTAPSAVDATQPQPAQVKRIVALALDELPQFPVGKRVADQLVEYVIRYDIKTLVQLRPFRPRDGIAKQQAVRGQILDDVANVYDVTAFLTVLADDAVHTTDQSFRVIREALLSLFVQIVVLHIYDDQCRIHIPLHIPGSSLIRSGFRKLISDPAVAM